MRRLIIDSAAVEFLRNWSVSETTGSRSTFSVTVLPPARPQMYQPIRLVDAPSRVSGARGASIKTLFEGVITKVNPVDDHGRVNYNVTAEDYSRIADYRLASFAAVNELAEDIVTDRLLPLLAADGITAGSISAAIQVKKAVFNFCTVSDALTQLATLCGGNYCWYITGKQLHFGPKTAQPSSIELNDSTRLFNFKYAASTDGYRNIQYVKGAKGWTSAQTETLEASGSEYTTRYPIALQPNITVNGQPATVGVSGLDGGNSDFSWAYDSRTINCNLETAPASINITYIGLMTIYTRKADANQIGRIARLSGGSGIRESLYVDDTIDTQDAAAQYCDALLEKYARDAQKITFTDHEDRWHVGELVYVFKYAYSCAGFFLVTERKIRAANADDLDYDLTLTGGSDYDGWITFFEQLAARPAGAVINADEIAVVLEAVDEGETLAGSARIDVLKYPTCSSSLICADTVILGTIISTDNVGD